MTSIRHFLSIALLLCMARAVAGHTERLTPLPGQMTATVRWAHSFPRSTGELNALIAEARNVEYRFDIPKYLGKKIRIFMTMPSSLACMPMGGGMRVEWQSRSTMRGGGGMSGQRALLYEGLLLHPRFTETLDLRFFLDASVMECPIEFLPEFDIESD